MNFTLETTATKKQEESEQEMQRLDAIRVEWLYEKRNEFVPQEALNFINEHYYLNKFSLFGLQLKDFCSNGFRIHGRTLIECTTDNHALNIGKEVSDLKERFFPDKRPIVIDLFTGSGNLLFHVANAVNAAKTYGFEMDKNVYEQTTQNFKVMNFQCELTNEDFKTIQVDNFEQHIDTPLVFIVCQPWGSAFSYETGLDLSTTSPPTQDIIDQITNLFPAHELFFMISAHEKMNSPSVQSLANNFSFFSFVLIEGIAVGRDYAIVLCSNAEEKQIVENKSREKENESREKENESRDNSLEQSSPTQSLKSNLKRNSVQQQFMNLLGSLQNLSIVDLGCGDGYQTGIFQRLTQNSVVGIDQDAVALQQAHKQYNSGQNPVFYVKGGIHQLNMGAKFDVVTAQYVICCCKTLDAVQEIVDSAFRNLKAGGRFIGVDKSPEYEIKTKSNAAHYQFTNEEWKNAFEQAGFIDFKWTSLSETSSDEESSSSSLDQLDDMCFIASKPIH